MRMPSRGYRKGGGGAGALGGRLMVIVVALVGLAVYWFSNQKSVPFTGRAQFNTMSVEQEVQLGAQAYMQILQQEGGAVMCSRASNSCSMAEREVVEAVTKIGRDLERAAIEWEDELRAEGVEFTPVAREFDWTYNVIQSDQPNAFCLPGGYVAVYSRMIDLTGDNDGRFELEDLENPIMLAVVMGHEIGHALAHHGAERMSQQKVAQLGQAAVAMGIGDMDPGQRQAILGAMGIATMGGLNAFSREHESEADRIGLELMVRACYDPRMAPVLWERMGALGGQRPPEWMSTHPASETRAENFRKWMPDAIAMYEERCGPLPEL